MNEAWADVIARMMITDGASPDLYQRLVGQLENRGFCSTDLREYKKPRYEESVIPAKRSNQVNQPLQQDTVDESQVSNTEDNTSHDQRRTHREG